ncbi:hypothetical protein TRIUR3_05332 [Triticum urartu]|uniref:Uncharacterized protein n=1 Tax=Triticum urartu TaxID=4572 RepID=M8ADA0_TRIUA|nr:hypothetical protein TRIUR3_05332 [Triticum urartu]
MNCTGQAELLVVVQLRQFASERDALLAQLANIATHSPMSPDADEDQIGRSITRQDVDHSSMRRRGSLLERMDAVCDSWFPEYRSASDNPLWSLRRPFLLMSPAGTPRMDGSTNCFQG